MKRYKKVNISYEIGCLVFRSRFTARVPASQKLRKVTESYGRVTKVTFQAASRSEGGYIALAPGLDTCLH